jgi:Uma2 family endonuclease
MLSVLENPALRSRAMPLSIAAWHELIAANLAPKRGELIQGVILAKPRKSFLHTKLAALLWERLNQAAGPGWWVRKEDPLTFEDSEPEPDISVVPGTCGDYTAHPSTAALVVEISVSTLAEDREMASLYATAGVHEYWIVNAPARCIEVHRHPAAGSYQERLTVTPDQELHPAALPGVPIPLDGLFS